MNTTLSPLEIASTLPELWSPRIIADVDDSYINGSLAWHCHDNEDELFLVLKGHLKIEMEENNIELNAGEMFVVPKGVMHNPIAAEECLLMLIEKKSTLHTGNTITDKTKSLEDQLKA